MNLQQLREDPASWHILQERAHALALQQVDTTIEQGDEVLSFRLGNDGYSLPARFVREVYPLQSWTPLPTTPAFVIGLVNVRGKILTALDVRPLLNIPPAPPKDGTFLIIINVHGVEIGLVADSVVEVRRGDTTLSPTLTTTVPWIRGLDKDVNLVIDPPQLLNDPYVVVNEATT